MKLDFFRRSFESFITIEQTRLIYYLLAIQFNHTWPDERESAIFCLG